MYYRDIVILLHTLDGNVEREDSLPLEKLALFRKGKAAKDAKTVVVDLTEQAAKAKQPGFARTVGSVLYGGVKNIYGITGKALMGTGKIIAHPKAPLATLIGVPAIWLASKFVGGVPADSSYVGGV